jgi:hypothetical protein
MAALGGFALGGALWFITGIVHGDALFHLGRVRKLDDFGSLSLHAVDEFRNGGLHPGYAFPLWHGWLALVAKLAGVDPAAVVLHEASLLAPLAVVLAFEAGRRVLHSTWLGAAAALAQVALIAFAPGGGGAYTSLALPGTVGRQLLVPAVLAVFFGFVREPSWRLGLTLAAAGMDLAFVHPTYALFLALPLVGFALARALAGRDLRRSALALVAFGVPVLGVFAWLEPIVAQTISHNPGPSERLRAVRTYSLDLVVHSTTSYHLAPSVVARTGSIALAALVLVPVAALAARRRWSAFVIGAAVLVLALELWSSAFTHFSDLVSLSQSRRAAGFVPFTFALAGGMAVVTRALRLLVLPVALAAGIALQLAYPGDFGMRVVHRSPAIAAWIALFGGLVALVALAVAARRGLDYERPGALAAAAVAIFTLPVFVHGIAQWNAPQPGDAYALTPGLVHYLRGHVPERSVVFADVETSYRISAFVPVYVAVGPPAHVANTRPNHLYARLDALKRFLRTGDLAIPRAYGARWLVLRRTELPLRRIAARRAYRDSRFVVFRL